MIKYLEKLSEVPNINPILLGSLVGGLLGGGLGQMQKKNPKTGKPLTKKQKADSIAALITYGAYLGANVGTLRYLLKNRRTRYHGNFRHPSPTSLKTHFTDMGASGGFKTKAEAHKHFKVMSSKFHPDKPGGDVEKMQKLNEAWTRAKAHPDFYKMASLNKYIEILHDNY